MLHLMTDYLSNMDQDDTDIPTTTLTDLVQDRCNFRDRTFETFVNLFMAAHMPGVPLSLLRLDEMNGDDCMDRFAYIGDDVSPYIREVLIINDEGNFVILDEKTREAVSADDAEEYMSLISDRLDGLADDCPDDGDEISLFFVDYNGDAINSPYHDESEAAQDVEAAIDESRYGFPWAWNWCFVPEDNIDTDFLKACGFTVAMMDDTRIAGIDGGGYSFAGAHFAPLAFAHAVKWGLAIPTDNGLRKGVK